MQIEQCKWYNNARSPVLFMIDDLANAWVDTSGNGTVDEGEDWGFFKDEERSSFRFLQERILADHPEVKVTFFVPVGERVGMIRNPVCSMYSKPIHADEASRNFFRRVHEHPNFELAYHGTTHGIVGEEAKDFVQEWASFSSLDEALIRIGEGTAIYEDVVGKRPLGGKYCGYTSNEFSDASIDEAGFEWWCRYWNRGRADGSDHPSCGQDSDPITNYDVKRFGSTGVIDIPSTVNGGLLNGINRVELSIKGITKRVLKKPLIRWKLRELDYLLDHRLIISIQEHIAPSRDDGKRQSPNIYDDCNSLNGMFDYLKDKNVWYCTGSELAEYVNLREHVSIVHVHDKIFTLEHEAKFEDQVISLKFNEIKRFTILLPNQVCIEVSDGIVNLPVMRGEYSIIKGGF